MIDSKRSLKHNWKNMWPILNSLAIDQISLYLMILAILHTYTHKHTHTHACTHTHKMYPRKKSFLKTLLIAFESIFSEILQNKLKDCF